VRFIFCKDEFIMHREIWMSQICHAHNCRAMQKRSALILTASLDKVVLVMLHYIHT
jgi:hypothetical protein